MNDTTDGLQESYAITRIINGVSKTVDVKPEDMTDQELLDLANRMERGAQACSDHAVELWQDYEQRNPLPDNVTRLHSAKRKRRE